MSQNILLNVRQQTTYGTLLIVLLTTTGIEFVKPTTVQILGICQSRALSGKMSVTSKRIEQLTKKLINYLSLMTNTVQRNDPEKLYSALSCKNCRNNEGPSAST